MQEVQKDKDTLSYLQTSHANLAFEKLGALSA